MQPAATPPPWFVGGFSQPRLADQCGTYLVKYFGSSLKPNCTPIMLALVA